MLLGVSFPIRKNRCNEELSDLQGGGLPRIADLF